MSSLDKTISNPPDKTLALKPSPPTTKTFAPGESFVCKSSTAVCPEEIMSSGFALKPRSKSCCTIVSGFLDELFVTYPTGMPLAATVFRVSTAFLIATVPS